MAEEQSVGVFNQDVDSESGYLYTNPTKLSCRLSNQRLSDAVAETVDMKGRRVVDVGCGDGAYTIEFARLEPASVHGVDAAEKGIEAARRRAADEGLQGFTFAAEDVYDIQPGEPPYDVAIVRGLLHHLYDAPRAIQAISQVAPTVVVVEPNGYNPVLKLIEKLSRYHVEHEEKSYAPKDLDRWFEDAGGKVVERHFVGLVPFFCPDWAAKFLRVLQPLAERLPGIRAIVCGQYVFRVQLPLAD